MGDHVRQVGGDRALRRLARRLPRQRKGSEENHRDVQEQQKEGDAIRPLIHPAHFSKPGAKPSSSR